MGINFAHFGLESDIMIFEGDCMNISTWLRKKREICEFEMNFKKSFMLVFLS